MNIRISLVVVLGLLLSYVLPINLNASTSSYKTKSDFYNSEQTTFKDYYVGGEDCPKKDSKSELQKRFIGCYSDHNLNLNFGNVSVHQKVPKNIQEALKVVEGELHLPLGLSLEVDTKFGKIKTEIESTKKSLDSLIISNNLGPFSLYYILDKKGSLSLDLESSMGVNLSLNF